MTPEEFLYFLNKATIVRKSTENERPVKLEEGDAEKIASIEGLGTAESCIILHELYEKYKVLGYYPKELLQAVYYVIYRDCIKLYKEEKKAYEEEKEACKATSDKNYKLLNEDGMIRDEKRPGNTLEVFKRVVGDNSKMQEKWGMSPFDDFMLSVYNPVDMFSLKRHGDLFRRIIVRVLQERFRSMFIDLSGDITLFEDIYPQKREMMLVSNSNIGDFYYIIKNEFGEFCKGLDTYMSLEKKEKDALIKNLIKDLEKSEKYTKKDLYEMLPTGVSKDLEYEEDDKKNYVFSYPYQYDKDRVIRAVGYFLSIADKKDLEDIETTKKKLKELGKRLSKTMIVCGTANSLLESIKEKEINILNFENVVKGKIKDTNIEESLQVWKEGHFEDLEMKKASPRRKKGFLFYDYTVRRNTQDMVSFLNFVNTHESFWMVVFDKEDRMVRELFRGKGRYSYELNTGGVFKNFFISVDPDSEVSVKKVLITNIKMDFMYIKEVEESPIFRMLDIAFKNEKMFNENFNAGKYNKILIQETTEEVPDYEEITEQLSDENEDE